jgi:crossover junction endodeoxyribonuclease RuvC
MSNTCIASIDPGVTTGAIAFVFTDHPSTVSAEDIPVANGQVDAATLARRLEIMKPDIAIIERVGSMPGQGVSSTFKFGQAYGTLIGVVAALKIPVHFVTPGKWKRHFGLSADKEESRARALQLWPARAELFARKRDHGRAEAALIARFAAETIVGRAGE